MGTNMKYQLGDLLGIPRLQSALDSLYLSSKIPSAIIDNDGIVHTGSGWQDICSKFHRAHPEARKRCVESDTYINDHIHEANPSITYKCPHGLVDAATPIIIEGEHLGNVFTGQLFLEEPDLEYFRAQASKYGFDKENYIDAVKRVPIIPEQALQEHLAFVAHLTGMLAEMGLKRAKEKEAGKRLRESEERYRAGRAGDGPTADGRGDAGDEGAVHVRLHGKRDHPPWSAGRGRVLHRQAVHPVGARNEGPGSARQGVTGERITEHVPRFTRRRGPGRSRFLR